MISVQLVKSKVFALNKCAEKVKFYLSSRVVRNIIRTVAVRISSDRWKLEHCVEMQIE